jgi:transcriptional regulator with XRE-family HTH domain
LIFKDYLDNIDTNGYIKIMTGVELKEWRKRRGLSQGDLAQHLGVFRVSVSRWETGARTIPSFLPLALEALENRMKMEENHGNH